MFLSLALLTCMLCSAKKPVKKQVQEKTAQEELLDSLKLAAEIKRMQAEMELEDMKYRAQKEELDRMYRPQEKFLNDVQEMELPCMSESNDTPEYYGGFGEGKGVSTNEAVMKAQMSAIQDLQKKSGKEDIKDAEIVCKNIMIDKFGHYNCYMAARIHKNDITEQK